MSRAASLVLALAFLALHLPYLPVSLEDLDSINFALGVHDFDVARHQPHPPGYPIFILLAKIARAAASSDARALAAISVAAATLGVVAIAWLFREIASAGRPALPDPSRGESALDGPAVAAAIAVTCPLYWFTAARPLSDSAGLAAAIAVQALILRARTSRAIIVAAFCAGLAIGIRSQVFWLAAPLLLFVCTAGVRTTQASDFRLQTCAAFAAGLLVWLVPLAALSGGPVGYWRAVSTQGGEDLSGIRMLWTTPTPREVADALYYAFIAPWAVSAIAAIVVAAALAGAIALYKSHRRVLTLLAVAFAPYLIFDILFQETFTIRYALPLVVPTAFLAAEGLGRLPRPLGIAACAALAMFDAHMGGRSVAAYSRQPAPAFRLLADMRNESEAGSIKPVFAPDRRQSLDLRKALSAGSGEPARAMFDRQLAAPPQHEWLEAVKYWNAGGRAPVWFVVDPRRSAMALVQHGDPVEYRWAIPQPILLSGTRPADIDWYRVHLPEWYLGEGWALTPEAEGIAVADRVGLKHGPIEGRVRASSLPDGALIVGGRNLEPEARARITISIGGTWSKALDVAPGFFLEAIRVPGDRFAASRADYVQLTAASAPPADVAIEQFDLSSARAVVGYGGGWFEPELDPPTGRRWRWVSEHGELRYMTPPGDWMLRLEGESPRRYYSRDSRIVVRSGTEVLADLTVGADFRVDVPVPAAHDPSTLVVETDQTHVPADARWRRSRDRRRLGLRIFKCELRPRASAPDRAASSLPVR